MNRQRSKKELQKVEELARVCKGLDGPEHRPSGESWDTWRQPVWFCAAHGQAQARGATGLSEQRRDTVRFLS